MAISTLRRERMTASPDDEEEDGLDEGRIARLLIGGSMYAAGACVAYSLPISCARDTRRRMTTTSARKKTRAATSVALFVC